MPISIPMPEGLEVPDADEFELPVTMRVQDGALYAVAVDGMPIPEMEEAEPEMEEEEPEMEEEGGGPPEDFMSAVESAMGSKR